MLLLFKSRVYTEELPGDAAVMLFIKNIREDDSGAYRCEGVYANNDQMAAEVGISTFSKFIPYFKKSFRWSPLTVISE